LETINQTCEANIGYGTAPQEIISTGIPQLDAVTGGGIPRGRIVEIHGNDGSGKTALALHLAQQTGGAVLYADADHGLSPYILRGRELYLLNVDTLEDALDACQTAAIGGFSAVVIDTVTAFPTGEDMRVGINDKYGPPRNQQAKIMSKCLPILTGLLHVTGCTLFLVNQLREKPGFVYGRPDRPTGGRAIGYFAALRLETRRIETMASGNVAIGQKVAVDVVKCKQAVQGKRAIVTLTYGKGIA
jgi:recombination protein RecA